MASSGSETSNVDVEQLASWTCAATIVAQKAREKRYIKTLGKERNAMQCRQSIPDHLFSTLLLEKPLPVQYRFTANLSSSNGKECMTKGCKPCKTVCFRPRKYRGPKIPHKKLKRRRISPSPSAQRLTKPLMISLRSRAREVVERRAYASTPPVSSSVLSAGVSRLPPAVLCPSACAREDSSGGVPAFSSSSSALNHVSSTTHFSSVSKRMKTLLEDQKGHPSVIPGYTALQFTEVPSGYQSERIS
jgi:hypothetical protein